MTQPSFSRWYSNEYYAAHQTAYPWQKKEWVTLPRAQRYFEGQTTDEEDALDLMKDAAKLFLNETGGHQLIFFLTVPNKWLSKARAAIEIPPETSSDPQDSIPCQITKNALPSGDELHRLRELAAQGEPITDEALLLLIAPDPLGFLKKFKITHKAMKLGAPKLYARIRGLLIEVMGVKRILEEWPKLPEAEELFTMGKPDADREVTPRDRCHAIASGDPANSTNGEPS